MCIAAADDTKMLNKRHRRHMCQSHKHVKAAMQPDQRSLHFTERSSKATAALWHIIRAFFTHFNATSTSARNSCIYEISVTTDETATTAMITIATTTTTPTARATTRLSGLDEFPHGF